MAEYIDRSQVLALYHYDDHDNPVVDCEDIEELPTADVVPVRRGRWIIKDKHIYQCNRCGNYLDIRGLNGGRGDANYCTNCGAKMNLGE